MEFVCLTLLILGYLSVMLSACSKCMDEPDSDSAELLDYYNTQAIKNKQSKVRRGKHLKSNPDSCAEILRGLPIRCSRAGGKNDCCCFMFRVFIIACLKLMPPSFFEPQVCWYLFGMHWILYCWLHCPLIWYWGTNTNKWLANTTKNNCLAINTWISPYLLPNTKPALI